MISHRVVSNRKAQSICSTLRSMSIVIVVARSSETVDSASEPHRTQLSANPASAKVRYMCFILKYMLGNFRFYPDNGHSFLFPCWQRLRIGRRRGECLLMKTLLCVAKPGGVNANNRKIIWDSVNCPCFWGKGKFLFAASFYRDGILPGEKCFVSFTNIDNGFVNCKRAVGRRLCHFIGSGFVRNRAV